MVACERKIRQQLQAGAPYRTVYKLQKLTRADIFILQWFEFRGPPPCLKRLVWHDRMAFSDICIPYRPSRSMPQPNSIHIRCLIGPGW